MKPAFKRQLCVSPLYTIKLPIFFHYYIPFSFLFLLLYILSESFLFVVLFFFFFLCLHLLFNLFIFLLFFIITSIVITAIFSFSQSEHSLSSVVYHLLFVFLVRAPSRDKYYGFSCPNNLLIY